MTRRCTTRRRKTEAARRRRHRVTLMAWQIEELMRLLPSRYRATCSLADLSPTNGALKDF